MRKVGLVLAVAASVFWLVITGLIVFPPDGAVPLGVFGLYFVAVPLSLVAAVVLALTLRRARSPARWTAAGLAVGSALLLLLIPVLGTVGAGPDYAIRGLYFVGVAGFIAATALFARPARDL